MRLASWQSYDLAPYFPLGTSRGTITSRRVWLLRISESANPEQVGIGEAAPLAGLSIEEPIQVEAALEEFCKDPSRGPSDFSATPSVRFAIEMAEHDLKSGGTRILFDSPFVHGKRVIPINGLIWMGDHDEMLDRLREKIDEGYRCMKMKVGAIDHEQELELLKRMRAQFKADELEIRVDANGAYLPDQAGPILELFADLEIHSIEQPIKAGHPDQMAILCKESPIPIALDEELIGVYEKDSLLDRIQPQYIILKPTLLGGFTETEEWIKLAEERGIGWWVTSALESNIGLNAIAQWTATLNTSLPQGLGTGAVFRNNFPSPLQAHAGSLHYRTSTRWDPSMIP
jgi:o-succinylbenzoate synthase